MEILSWIGIFCIVYGVIAIITFVDIMTELSIDGDDNPLVLVFAILMMGAACLMSVFWPVYWYVKIKENTGKKE